MSTLQTPSWQLFGEPDLSSDPSSYTSPDMQDSNKKKMQTTVAIREKDPHYFKILPLKQVPVEQRPVDSPSLNFDRPFTSSRLELPTMYQLSPDREASSYFSYKVNNESSRIARPGSPPPHKTRERRTTSHNKAAFTFNSSDENVSNLALKARDSLAGRPESLTSLASIESSIEHILAETCDSPQDTPMYFLREPELTFGTDNDISCPSSLGTPLNSSTPSSGGSRKAKSLYILDNLDSSALLKSTVDHHSAQTIISQRRVRTKAFSVSSLSTGQSNEDIVVPDRKRHAIYADSNMQFNIPADVSRTSSVVSVFDENSPSNRISSYSPSKTVMNKKLPGHLYTKSEALPNQQLGLITSATRSTPKRKKSIYMLPTVSEDSSLAVSPLKPKLKPKDASSAVLRHDSYHTPSDAVTHCPIILELLQDLDTAIQEWKACSMFTCI